MRGLTGGRPKELLCVGDVPLIIHTLQEAADAGASTLFIVVSPAKPALREYLETGAALMIHGERVRFGSLNEHGIETVYIEQREPLGLAHAVSLTEPYIGSQDFFLLLPDNYFPEDPSPSRQLLEQYTPGRCCTGVLEIPAERLPLFSNSSIVTFAGTGKNAVLLTALSGKKQKGYAPDHGTGISMR